jgi:hypothetical protein
VERPMELGLLMPPSGPPKDARQMEGNPPSPPAGLSPWLAKKCDKPSDKDALDSSTHSLDSSRHSVVSVHSVQSVGSAEGSQRRSSKELLGLAASLERKTGVSGEDCTEWTCPLSSGVTRLQMCLPAMLPAMHSPRSATGISLPPLEERAAYCFDACPAAPSAWQAVEEAITDTMIRTPTPAANSEVSAAAETTKALSP